MAECSEQPPPTVVVTGDPPQLIDRCESPIDQIQSGSESGEDGGTGDTPPHQRWAINLRSVLYDYEGQQLFRLFLEHEEQRDGLSCLNFFFIIRNMRIRAREPQQLCKFIGRIVQDCFISTQGTYYCHEVKDETRRAIVDQYKAVKEALGKLRDGEPATHVAYDPDIFDQALRECTKVLQIKHQAFTRSQTFLNHVNQVNQTGVDSPVYFSNSSGSSSNSGDPPLSTGLLLPTVHEDDEETAPGVGGAESKEKTLAAEGSRSWAPVSDKLLTTSMTNDTCVDTMTMHNSMTTGDLTASMTATSDAQQQASIVVDKTSLYKSASLPRPSSRSGAGTAKQPIATTTAATVPAAAASAVGSTTPTLTQKSLKKTEHDRRLKLVPLTHGPVPNPYHTNYVPHLPTSAQDSELQSSEADSNVSRERDTRSDSDHPQLPIKQYVPPKVTKRTNERLSKESMRRNALLNSRNEGGVSHMPSIPRTQRADQLASNPSPQDPLNFFHEVARKLQIVKQNQEDDTRLNSVMREISADDSHTNYNDRKQALLDFGKKTAAAQQGLVGVLEPQDELSNILDEHVNRVWHDTPTRQSPMRSPGAQSGAYSQRRRSPRPISPDRGDHQQNRRPRGPAGLMHQSYPTSAAQFTNVPGMPQAAYMPAQFPMQPQQGVPPMGYQPPLQMKGANSSKVGIGYGYQPQMQGAPPMPTMAPPQPPFNPGGAAPHLSASQLAMAKSFSRPLTSSMANTCHPASTASENLEADRRASLGQSANKMAKPGNSRRSLGGSTQGTGQFLPHSDSSGIETASSSGSSVFYGGGLRPMPPGSVGMPIQEGVNSPNNSALMKQSDKLPDTMSNMNLNSGHKQRSNATPTGRNSGSLSRSTQSAGERSKTTSSSGSSRGGVTASRGRVAGDGSAPADAVLQVCYHLPGEATPYLMRYASPRITVATFRDKIVPKQYRTSSYNYCFKCVSEVEDGMGDCAVWKFLSDSEEIPLFDGKIQAKINAV